MAKKKKHTLRWYYDSCALEESVQIVGEIINKKNPKEVIISHLTLGEALGNSLKKGEEVQDSFIKLIKTIRSYIKVVGNDNVEKILDDAYHFFRLSLTDAIHVATAIKHKCTVLRTSDRDLYGIDKSKIARLGKKYGIENFSISKI